METHQRTHPIHYVSGCYDLEGSMANLKENLLLNRIIALLVGGLIVFGIMSITVVKTGKEQLAEMSSALDTSLYEAGRLLDDAKAQFESNDYTESKATLEKLFTNQPGSTEAAEGETLLATINTAEAASEARWEEALPQIKEEWSEAMATQLRAESEEERVDMEAGLVKTIIQAWDDAKSEVRTEWEAESKF